MLVVLVGCGGANVATRESSPEPETDGGTRPTANAPARGRPAVVAGPPVRVRSTPTASSRLRVEGFVAFHLVGGSPSLVDSVHRWTLDERMHAARDAESSHVAHVASV